MVPEEVAPVEVESVCIRAPNWVGDVVMATPLFRAVRQALPDTRVILLIRKKVEPVLRKAPWFDDSVVYDRTGGGRVRPFMQAVLQLRDRDPDLGIVLPNSFSSALMMRMGGVSRTVGYAKDCRSFLLSTAVPRRQENGQFKPTYMADYYLRLAEELGIGPAGRVAELTYDEQDMRAAQSILQSQDIRPDRDVFLLHPGAGYGPAKRWSDERFARLAELLQEEFQAQIGIIGGPGEREHIRSIISASRANLVDLSSCGIDLHLLKCVVARSALLVSTDSGPRHYGIALGVPTVCVMGPNKPEYSTTALPYDIVVRVDQECGPCQRKVCPREHRCMTEITPEMVLEACRSALVDASQSGRTQTVRGTIAQ